MSKKTRALVLVAVVLALTATGFFSLKGNRTDDPSRLVEELAKKGKCKYVGAAVCMSCHSQKELGKQFQKWTGSPHARSYLVLETGNPEMIDEEAKGMVEVGYGCTIAKEAERLGVDTHCLMCHATGAEVDTSYWEPTFHIEDGVQCEACHGPGSKYVPAMSLVMKGKLKKLPPEIRPKMPTPNDCMRCHREKLSHAVLKIKPFEFQKMWKRIAHSLLKR